MTSDTGCLHSAVIHPLGRERCLAAMAKRTFVSWHACRQGGRNVIARLAKHSRVIPTMAGRTRSGDNPGVRIGFLHRRPGDRGVTNLTPRSRRHVVRQLYVHTRIRSKVAAGAVRCLSVRIGEQWHPCQTGTVAGITLLRSNRNMHCWLAGSRRSVMAGRASCGDTRMREGRRFPGRRRVADIARLGGWNMRHIFTQGACCSVCAIMTSRTTTVGRRHAVMRHRRRVEGRVVLVASVASRRRRDMQGRFALRIGPVVAG